MPRPSGWFGTKEAATYLGITTRTLYRLIDEAKVVAYEMGRVIRLRQEDLDAYLDAARVQPGTLRHLYPGATERPTLRERTQRLSRYDPLRHHLLQQVGEVLTATFAEIEAIVGPLPNSARKHDAWWRETTAAKPQVRAWTAAGWRVVSVSLTTERVTFERC